MDTRANLRMVVVGVDGSSPSMNAARFAAYLARALHAPLLITHAVPGCDNPAEKASHSPCASDSRQDAGARELVDRAVGLVRTCESDIDVRTEISYGPADSMLRALSAHASFVVIGAQTIFGSKVVGATTAHVATRAHCPVVVWRGVAGRPLRRRDPIMVGVDETAASQPAIGCAFEVAAALDAPIVAIHALAAEDDRANLKAMTTRSLAQWKQKFPDVRASVRVIAGSAVAVLTEAAGEAQLVVLGSRARSGAAAVLLGSTSRHMLHRAPCPVLVCPMRERVTR